METMLVILILLILQMTILWAKRRQEFDDLNLWFINAEMVVGVLIGVVKMIIG